MAPDPFTDLRSLRETEFADALAAHIPLNHAGIAPSPARVVRAVTEAIRAMGRDPLPFFIETLLPAMNGARDRLARLMGVPAEHLAFTKNTAQGIAIVADGLDLAPGENVVTAACEYPAVVYPWYGQASRGVETRLVPTRPDGTLSLDDFAARMDDKTRVVALSWVEFGTGFRAEVAAFAELAHSRGAILVLDVIQALGALPCHVTEWGADVAATGVQKWLMAPVGMGALYVAPHVLERMRLVNMGAGSVENMLRFDSTEFTPRPTVQRYEEGSPNALGLVGLDAALSLIEEAGIERIAARVLQIADYAARALESKSYEVLTPRDSASRLHSALVMFRHPRHKNDDLLAALTAADVAAADRGGLMRFSPHFYNDESDIDRAVDALPG